MESNSEHTKLQLSHVTGTVQSSLKYLTRAVISPKRLYEQVSSIAQMFLCISKHGTVASLSSVIIVVLTTLVADFLNRSKCGPYAWYCT